MARLDRHTSVGYLTNMAARLLTATIAVHLRPFGVAPGYLPVFYALEEKGTQSQKALAEWTGLEQPTMAATLSRMQRDGLVEARPDPRDRRSILYSLSSDGLAKVDRVRSAVDTVNRMALSALAEDQAAQYRANLQKMIEALERGLDGHGPEPQPTGRGDVS